MLLARTTQLCLGSRYATHPIPRNITPMPRYYGMNKFNILTLLVPTSIDLNTSRCKTDIIRLARSPQRSGSRLILFSNWVVETTPGCLNSNCGCKNRLVPSNIIWVSESNFKVCLLKLSGSSDSELSTRGFLWSKTNQVLNRNSEPSTSALPIFRRLRRLSL